MEPVIYFNLHDVKGWVGETYINLYNRMENLRKSVKTATGYTWDNSHFYITDIYGKPALSVAFDHVGLSFWNAVDRGSLPYFIGNETTRFSKEKFAELSEWVKHIRMGKGRCCSCGKWISMKKLINYSFAGKVCSKCFNPKIHKGPDTRGD